MVQSGHGGNVVVQTGVDDVVVMGYAEFIDRASTEGKQSGPGDGERVCVDPNGSKTGNIYSGKHQDKGSEVMIVRIRPCL